jgi:hypothetical protein
VVEYKSALSDGGWTELRRVAGTGSVEFVDDADVTGPTRFYRLRIE